MIYGDIVNHFHYKHGLTNARAAEKTYFTALGIGHQKVYYLNSRFKQLGCGLLLIKRGCAAVYRQVFFRLYFALFVNRSAENVNHAAYNLFTHGHLNAFAVGCYFKVAAQALCCFKRYCARNAAAQMRGYFGVLCVFLNGNKRIYRRYLPVIKANIYNRSRYFNYFTRVFH